MKHIQTPSHTFMAVRLDTTGNVLRKPFDVVKKFSIVVTPRGLDIRRIRSWRNNRLEETKFCTSFISQPTLKLKFGLSS
jgi:hypothetical protein